MLPDANARCAVHPQVRAIEVCARCGSYICGDCMEIEGVDAYCRDCFEKVSTKAPHGGRATAAIVCGILGINGCLPLAIPAILLGHMELAAIERGESPPSGRNLAKGGMILGYIGTVISVVAIVGLLLFLA
ncbi:MAG: DUF4190 domain-containing protein [Sandaracinaceae bacterium]|nr:DUF4190 domain-containing protein [Sandaracinaceae bacterium]